MKIGSDTIDLIGLGTYSLEGKAGAEAVATAIESGYRLIDSAVKYGNETAVGQGITDSGIDRADIFLTTKVLGGDQGRGNTREGLAGSLRHFGTEYVDLLLIHWPNPSRGLAAQTWEEMIELKEEGLVRHIGVSNFLPEHITALVDETGVWPEVNQIQLTVALPKREQRAFHDEHGILTQAWGPLGKRHELTGSPQIRDIAAAHGVTPEQVALRWLVQQNIIAIPKSADPQRQRANRDVFGFELTAEEMKGLEALETSEDPKWDPRTHEEW